jgi:hypothetical protein|tara:strand:+ start:1857 stop:1982 length:126 start_codon:yes stop_codon:yes gene_type:complete
MGDIGNILHRGEEKMRDILEDDMLKPVPKEFALQFEELWRE